MATKTILTDGAHAKSINQLLNVPEAWTWISGGPQVENGLKQLQKDVPWLYRGIQIRMNSVAQVPFTIYQGEDVYDTSDNWENKCGFWNDPRRTIMLAEGALTIFGKAYFFKNPSMTNKALGLKYWFPLTVKAVIDEEKGLLGFDRKLPGKQKPAKFNPEDILHIWGVDPYVEIGPPLSSPATAALAGAGVLWNVDEFSAAFFKRGAVKATILSVPQGTQPEERSRIREWWSRAIQGNSNSFATEVINSEAVTATTIGEGIKELENVELTKEKREDIATALGIPQSKMFSTSSTDSNREEDEKSIIEDMSVPEAKLIEEAFNTQIWEPLGLRMQFEPGKLGVYQEDEHNRSLAFKNYVDATGKDKASIWAGFLGIELPDNSDLENLDSEPFDPMALKEQFSKKDDKEDKEPDFSEKDEERKQFSRWAKKRPPEEWHKFTFNHLSDEEQIALIGKNVPQGDDKTELVKALTGVIDELRSTKEAPSFNIYNQQPEVKVFEKDVVVNVPEQVAPVVNVTNDIPEQKSNPVPVVNVSVEPTPVTIENEVNVPEPKPKKTKVTRNNRGEITGMETE